MSYEYFELGICDRLDIAPHQLTKIARETLKLAYNAAPSEYHYQQEDEEDTGIPWGRMALMGLLAGGGAYAHGRWAQGSPFQGFSKGVDTNVINPVTNKFNEFFRPAAPNKPGIAAASTAVGAGAGALVNGGVIKAAPAPLPLYNPEQAPNTGSTVGTAGVLHGAATKLPTVDTEAAAMRARVNKISDNSEFNGITTKSQLQGTPYYNPDIVDSIAEPAGTVAGGGMLGYLGSKGLGWAGSKIAPATSARLGASTLGTGVKLLGTGVRSMMPGLGATMAYHDSKQLGDKYVDWTTKNLLTDADRSPNNPFKPILDARNAAMKGVITAGGTAMGAMGVRGVIPVMLNRGLNMHNEKTLLNNQNTGRVNALQNEFQSALSAKQNSGDNVPLNAWYKNQSKPGQRGMTVGQFPSEVRKQVISNRPL